MLVGTALVTAAVVAPAQLGARVTAMAVVTGVLAAVLRDWRACAGVTAVAALIFVGFLAHRDGILTGNPSAWDFTLAIGVAAVLGRGLRRIGLALPVPVAIEPTKVIISRTIEAPDQTLRRQHRPASH